MSSQCKPLKLYELLTSRLSVVYFRTLALLSDRVLATILDVMSKCLRDENQEVREMASASLAGLIRCSERRMVNVLKVCGNGYRI